MKIFRKENREKDILKAFERYIDGYFAERSAEKTFACFSSNLRGFGTGIDEIARNTGDFKPLYIRDFEQAPGAVDVKYQFIDVAVMSDRSGIVSAVFSISTDIAGQPLVIEGLRLTAAFIKEKQNWLLSHMHLSLPAELHEEGESYPIKELQERNRVLEKMVEEKTSELALRNKKLEEALLNVKQLSGLLPICASCKKIRDDEGYWHQIENYLKEHSGAEFTHGICPECGKKVMKEILELEKKRDKL